MASGAESGGSEKLARARKAPLRAHILHLYEEDKSRPLRAPELLDDVAKLFGPVSLSHLEYHLRWLREAGLIPPGGEES